MHPPPWIDPRFLPPPPPGPPQALFGWTIGLTSAGALGSVLLLFVHGVKPYVALAMSVGLVATALTVVVGVLGFRISAVPPGQRSPYWTAFGVGAGVVVLAWTALGLTFLWCLFTLVAGEAGWYCAA